MTRRAPAAVPVDVLRAAVRETIGTRSVREVAADIGISHTGLRGFLNGSNPHLHTRRKLEEWLTRTRFRGVRERVGAYAAPAGQDTFNLGLAATRALAETIRPDLVGLAERGYVRLIADLFDRAGREPPDWLDRNSEPDGPDDPDPDRSVQHP